MRSMKLFYVGEVLDIYQKGNNNWYYGSVATAISATELLFLSLQVFLPLLVVSASYHLRVLFIQFTIIGPS
jgi:hypothetical protein